MLKSALIVYLSGLISKSSNHFLIKARLPKESACLGSSPRSKFMLSYTSHIHS